MSAVQPRGSGGSGGITFSFPRPEWAHSGTEAAKDVLSPACFFHGAPTLPPQPPPTATMPCERKYYYRVRPQIQAAKDSC